MLLSRKKRYLQIALNSSLNEAYQIIGNAEKIEAARQGIIYLIQGAKQANVYAYLEKHHPKPIMDLGLKEK